MCCSGIYQQGEIGSRAQVNTSVRVGLGIAVDWVGWCVVGGVIAEAPIMNDRWAATNVCPVSR